MVVQQPVVPSREDKVLRMGSRAAARRQPGLSRSGRVRLTSRRLEMIAGLLFVAPVVLHLLIFKYFPVLYSIRLSMFRGTLLNPFRTYFGIANYEHVFTNAYAIRGFTNTFVYALIYVPAAVVIGMVLGLIVAKPHFGRTFFRAAYYTPVVVSVVAAVQVWAWILSPERYGIMNTLFSAVGLPQLGWLRHPNTALISLAIMGLWNSGLNMLIYLAALNGISPELYECARVDGASRRRQFWSITLPLLMPTTYFVVITSTILALKLFEPVLLLTGGGPLNSTTTVAYQIYEQAFQFSRWGRASAQATIFFFLVLFITVIQYKYLPESYEK